MYSPLCPEIKIPLAIIYQQYHNQYHTEQKSKSIKEIEVSAIKPPAIELVMNYMQKRIEQIEEIRKSFKVQYPDLLPEIA